MVVARCIIVLSVDADQRRALVEIARSRVEPPNRVELAGIILAYLDKPSAYAVARMTGEPTDGEALRLLATLGDRPRTCREATITAEARTWLVGLACAKPTQSGYPHELWTTPLLAAHARDHRPGAGRPSLANLPQGTACKIPAATKAVKLHKVRYYLERRDPEFGPKMAEVLYVYREAEMSRAAGSAGESAVAVVSHDEKPGVQAITTTAPDRPPVLRSYPTIGRDHEYKRHRIVILMAGIDLLTGQGHVVTAAVILTQVAD